MSRLSVAAALTAGQVLGWLRELYRATSASCSGALTNLGRPEEALTVTGEAVGLYRALTDIDRAAFHGRLADALIAWSVILLHLRTLR